MNGSRLVFAGLAVVLGLVASLALAEVLARAGGYSPWSRISELDDRPFVAMREPDPVVGWRNKPGSYLAPPYVPGGRRNRIRILPDGSRATSDQPPREGPRAVLLGGSFIFGQAISDHETMAWQLQEADRRRRYANFGVASYGTYQSLLSLERIFSGDDRPASVIYGLIGHHKIRNVGRSAWLRHLSRFSRYSEVTLPYCSLDDSGRLVRHPPARYPAWPLRTSLAIVNLFFDTITDALNERRFRQKQRITELLLLEMYQLCRSHDAKLIVALVGNEPRNPSGDARFLRQQGIPFVDCRFPHTTDLRVEGEGHPNATANRKWVRCVEPVVRESGH